MIAEAILNEAALLGLHLTAREGRIIATPKGKTPPYFAERVRAHKIELLDFLGERGRLGSFEQAKVIGKRCEEAGQDVAEHPAAFPYLISGAEFERKISPARSLIGTVKRHCMALRVDGDGTLLFESYGSEWDFLMDALKTHSQEIARIVLTTAQTERIDVVRADA